MCRFWMIHCCRMCIFLAVCCHLSSGSECDAAMNSSDYGDKLLFNVDCSSGVFSLSNERVEISYVTVESRCNGTGIVNQSEPYLAANGYDGVGRRDRTFKISEDVIPLNWTGECVLTACFYVDDPDNQASDSVLYLADHKPTCTFGHDSPTQSTITETTYYTDTSSLLQSMLSSTIRSTKSASHSISEKIFATILPPSLSSTITFASPSISEEIFTTVSTIIPSSSSQILPSSVAPAAGISNQTILLASTIPMAIMLVVILLVLILALFICIRRTGHGVKHALADYEFDFKQEEKMIASLSCSGSTMTFTQPLGPKSPSVSECSTSSDSSDSSLADIMSPQSQDKNVVSDSSQATADVASNMNQSDTGYIPNDLQTAQTPQHMLASDDYIYDYSLYD